MRGPKFGRALSPISDDVVIGNKVGATRGAAGEWLVDNRPETVRRQVDEALFDLRAETSLLTYLRLPGDTPGPGNAGAPRVPLEESLGTLVELRDDGKIRHIGLSGASPKMRELAQQITPIAAVQNRFNLIDRSGVEVLAACERHGIAFVPYFPLATGGIAGVDPLSGIAARLGVPTSKVALAWLLRRSPVILPIPGTASLTYLDANIDAAAFADELTDDDVDALTAIEDEDAATLEAMPPRMTDAFTRSVTESRR